MFLRGRAKGQLNRSLAIKGIQAEEPCQVPHVIPPQRLRRPQHPLKKRNLALRRLKANGDDLRRLRVGRFQYIPQL